MTIGCSRLSIARFMILFDLDSRGLSWTAEAQIWRFSPAELKPGTTFTFPNAHAAHTGVKPIRAAHTGVRSLCVFEIQDAALQSPRSRQTRLVCVPQGRRAAHLKVCGSAHHLGGSVPCPRSNDDPIFVQGSAPPPAGPAEART